MPGKNRDSGGITLKNEFIFWGTLSGAVFLDIFTKFLSDKGVFSGFPILSARVHNKGVTGGMGSSLPPALLLSIGVLLVIGLLIFRYKNRSLKSDLVIAVLIGGALGNQYDRMRWGHVRDFIQWPVFNVADILICVGVAYYIIDTYYSEKYKKIKDE